MEAGHNMNEISLGRKQKIRFPQRLQDLPVSWRLVIVFK